GDKVLTNAEFRAARNRTDGCSDSLPIRIPTHPEGFPLAKAIVVTHSRPLSTLVYRTAQLPVPTDSGIESTSSCSFAFLDAPSSSTPRLERSSGLKCVCGDPSSHSFTESKNDTVVTESGTGNSVANRSEERRVGK